MALSIGRIQLEQLWQTSSGEPVESDGEIDSGRAQLKRETFLTLLEAVPAAIFIPAGLPSYGVALGAFYFHSKKRRK